MREETPQIVHFSGHGAGEADLYFEDAMGNPKHVTGGAIASLFKLSVQTAPIECVVLNGSYSQVQAKAIVEHVSRAVK